VTIGGLVFHAEPLQELKQQVRGLRAGATGSAPVTIDVGSFKQRFGLTRKHAIPLLEWLDRERVTRRVGEKRVVL
jgi:selenocysteine-specific elongation factor